jgi:hypothetical protein
MKLRKVHVRKQQKKQQLQAERKAKMALSAPKKQQKAWRFGRSSLHFVDSAFAVEDMPRLSGTFAFAPLWLFATADVRAYLVAADNFLFWRNDDFFLIFRHFQVSLGSGAIPDRT